jgi:hypothetical protein
MLEAILLALLLHRPCQDSLPRARCTFQSDGVADVLDGLMACGDERDPILRAERALEHHASLHGWGSIDSVDFVSPERAAACSPRELALLATVTLPCADGSAIWVRLHLAQCFERNGRIDQALRILEKDLAEMLAAPADGTSRGLKRAMRTAKQRWNVSYIAERAARIAARHGRWALALGYAQHWTPTSRCSIGAGLERDRIRHFRAGCLLWLGRLAEVRTLCIEAVTNRWGRDAQMVEPWIESHVRGQGAISPELAVELLAAFADPSTAEEIRTASRSWFARQLPAR